MKQQLDKLAVDLFMEFARFEYSLKAAGFHSEEDGDATPDWTAFANSIPNLFEDCSDADLASAVEYFRQHPPKKQVIKDGRLDWDVADPRNAEDADRILILVRRVRNNLFHGGKFNGHWFEPDRSEELMRHSLKVLEVCRNASGRVRAAYKGSCWPSSPNPERGK